MADWSGKIVPRLVGKYFSNPGYLRIDGRPVFIDFNLQFDTLATAQQAYDVLREATRKALGVTPFLLKRVGEETRPENLRHYFAAQRMDGLTCFRFPVGRPDEAYAETLQRWHGDLDRWIAYSAAAEKGRRAFVPCGTTTFDPRPWYMIGWGHWMNPEFSSPGKRPYNRPAAPGEFRAHLAYLREMLDRFPAITHGMAILYAWNEWGEGGILEPSETAGSALLDEVSAAFAQPAAAAPPALRQTVPIP
jgi:hypothetical protein